MQIGAMNHPARDSLGEIDWFGRHGFVPEKELEKFIEGSRGHAAGWVGFYWGKPPEELRRSRTISDALTLGLLELFERRAKVLEK